MPRKIGIDVFEEHNEAFQSAVGSSVVVASRTRCATLGKYATIHAKAQESYSLIVMLDDLPKHEFWSDEGHINVPHLARGSLHLLDLRASGNARFGSSFDTLNVAIPRASLTHLAEQLGTLAPEELRVPVAWSARDPVIEGLQTGIVAAIAGWGDSMDPLVADHLMMSLITHMAIRYGGMRRPSPALCGAMAPWQLKRAQQIMGDSLDRHQSLAELAKHCDLSPSHFSRAFKAATGKSPSAWLFELRISRAKDLLRSEELSLCEIAARCGFADQSHFTRSFSRHEGRPPGNWRRTYRRC